MLFGTVLLWALNSTVTRYVVTHGFHPLAYATIRYGAATLLFWGFTYSRERSFRIGLRDMRLVVLAALMIFSNQLCFVYSIDKTSASTVTLFLAMTPIFIGVIASAVGLERLGRSFWIATVVSIAGVGFVASGSGGFSGNALGNVLATSSAFIPATYGVYRFGSNVSAWAIPPAIQRTITASALVLRMLRSRSSARTSRGAADKAASVAAPAV